MKSNPTTEPIPFIAAPEIDGIRCNECGRGSQVAVISAPEETVEQRITQIHKAQANKFEEKKQQIIQAGDEKAEPNPWLRRVGWAEHLQGLDRERLRESMGPIGEDEATLQRMWDSLGRVMDQARAAAVPIRVGHAVLFEVNRKEAHVKARKPFDSRMEDDTWSAIVSGLAVMGIREDGGWENVDNYTPIYSAVIKMARMLVVYQAVMEQQDEMLELKQTMSKEEAEETATGLFTIVRKKVRRFLIVVSDKTEPGPIDWIFDARTYGMRIRYTMTAAPTIDWVGDRISYQRIRFNMHELSDMLHGLVQEVRAVMGRFLMVEKDDFRSIPRIEWTKIEDDHSEDGIGYSFLQDDRNPWVKLKDPHSAHPCLRLIPLKLSPDSGPM
ncbi:hypothetical protein V8F06_013895 [Rhypophila decipiens]